MSKHTDFIFTCATVENDAETMNYVQAMREHKFNTNQMHDNTPLHGKYDKLSMTRVHRYQGQRLNQLTCCFGDVQPVQRNREDVNHDLGCEDWLQKNVCH